MAFTILIFCFDKKNFGFSFTNEYFELADCFVRLEDLNYDRSRVYIRYYILNEFFVLMRFKWDILIPLVRMPLV